MSLKSKKRRQRKEEEREELLAPDAFEEKGATWASWSEKNLKFIVLGVLIAFLLIVGIEILRSSGAGSASEYTQKLIDATDTYGEALNLQTVATSTKPEEDRARYSKARAAFEALLQSGPPDGIAVLAKLYDADLARRLGDHEAAITAYDAYLQNVQADDPLRVFALEGKGYVLEAAGRSEEAIATFRQMESIEAYADYALKHLARLLEGQGDKAGAKAAYEKIMAREPSSPLRDFAEQQLNLID